MNELETIQKDAEDDLYYLMDFHSSNGVLSDTDTQDVVVDFMNSAWYNEVVDLYYKMESYKKFCQKWFYYYANMEGDIIETDIAEMCGEFGEILFNNKGFDEQEQSDDYDEYIDQIRTGVE